jgi:hypothetical protein
MMSAPIDLCRSYNESCHEPPHSLAAMKPLEIMNKIRTAVIQWSARAVTV